MIVLAVDHNARMPDQRGCRIGHGNHELRAIGYLQNVPNHARIRTIDFFAFGKRRDVHPGGFVPAVSTDITFLPHGCDRQNLTALGDFNIPNQAACLTRRATLGTTRINICLVESGNRGQGFAPCRHRLADKKTRQRFFSFGEVQATL